MFAALTPPPAIEEMTPYQRHHAALLAWEPPGMIGRDPHGRPQVRTRAASHDGIITLYHPDTPLPIEVVVRGMPCVISYHGGYATHAIEPAGSPFWSETGYRSMGGMLTDPDEIVADIERYIDAPAKNGNGCGRKLKRWWPSYILTWHQSVAFELQYGKDRSQMWAQWGPEKHAEHWAKHDAQLAAALEQMRSEGIDPNDVGPPSYFKGKWPRFDA